jgi:mRNA-degrading endonuclease RelE of RelBE toxin-antitoxin system
MSWTIKIPTKVGKQIKKLPDATRAALLLLIRDLETNGPATSGGWKNFSKLKGMAYVCCWEVTNKSLKITEVYYVGTHEKAPY